MRDIHALPGARVSLSYYHFGSEEAVLQAVVDRRAEEHMQDILGSLRHSLTMYAHDSLPLDVLIEAYVRPCLERRSCHGADWKNYIRRFWATWPASPHQVKTRHSFLNITRSIRGLLINSSEAYLI